MKKILFFCSAYIVLTCGGQTLKVNQNGIYNPVRQVEPENGTYQAMTTTVFDTLQYFFNKHYYRNSTNIVPPTGNQENELFYTVATPYTGTANITHVGSIFTNSTSVTIHGLEGIVSRDPSSVSASIPVRFYLCNVNASNLPVMPPLDSVTTAITTALNGSWIGGTFTAPITVTGKFAVLLKIVSVIPGDTIQPFMNNASTATSTVPARQKYGESLGLLRFNGTFYTTNGLFGAGTDYEFLVAPRVSFPITAGASAVSSTACTNGIGSFTNTSTPTSVLENRQFNFNKFVTVWRGTTISASANTLAATPVSDSIYQWSFSGSTALSSYQKNPAVTFTLPGIQSAGLTAYYKPSYNGGFTTSLTDVTSATINVTINSAPQISISGNTAICAGNTTTLTAGGNPTFTWTNPATISSFVIVNPIVTTIYTVNAESGGCISTRTVQVIVSIPANVTVNGATQACVGKSYSLAATGANSYLWSTGSTASVITAVAQTTGTADYTVTGTNAGCPPSVVIKQVIINPLPVVTVVAGKALVCKTAQTETISLNGNPAGGFYSGTNVAGGTFIASVNGTFTATYSYTDPATTCAKSATTQIVVDPCSGIDKAAHNNPLLVYPNPSDHGMVNLANMTGVSRVEVYNILGMVVAKTVTDKTNLTLDLSAQPAGNYFVKVTDDNGDHKTVKIVNQP